MLVELITTEGGNGVQLMVFGMGKGQSGGTQGIVEFIVGIVHLINTEDSLQATFVESLVVSYQGKSLYQRFYLRPYFTEVGGIVGVLSGQSVHAAAPVGLIVGFGLYERV